MPPKTPVSTEEAKVKDPKPSLRAVAPDEDDMRLDRWLKRHFPAFSHGVVQKLLRKGQIRVDGKRAESSTRLKAGQNLRLPPSMLAEPQDGETPKKIAPRADWLKDLVLFQDDDVIALNKPAGLAVQGGTGIKQNLDDLLMVFSVDGVTKPKLVHRLDRDTSGVLLIARTPFAAARLAEAFRERDTRKIYWAVTVGVPKPQEGKIEAALVRRGETMQVIDIKQDPEAKRAATLYKTIDTARPHASFVALWPLTGRTHQLRVHLAHLGTPILGDRHYGGAMPEALPQKDLGTGLHLHARRLIIPHPRRGIIDVTAPLGKEMLKTWKWFQFDPKEKTDFTRDD